MPKSDDSRTPEALPPSMVAWLKGRFGAAVDPEVSLSDVGDPVDAGGSTSGSSQVLTRLESHGAHGTRYRHDGELARGGMGSILRIWDPDLRRNLAMKVMLDRPADGDAGAPSAIGRFLEEAQVTGQLDHPGIVPVHELGIDAEGRVYFTMRLVRGRDLREVFGLVSRGEEGWSVTRALGVVLRVCEAMTFAHAKGVIHRDLKPANVMVGRYGEVYVMDWGLARVIGREDRHDLRWRAASESAPESVVETDRRSSADAATGEELLTMDGEVLGTPAYMAPEQASGRVDELGARSDVYSVGAMLYHLLAGQMPFVPPGAKVSAKLVLMRVVEGPPRPLHELAPDAPAELVAICEKAMARDPRERYADMSALADDLRAFLEHRVVQAYRTGAVAELTKWVRRNRGLAAAMAGVLVATLAGLAGIGYVESQGRAAADAQRALAEENERRALTSAAEARRERANVLRLSAIQNLEELVAEAEQLWPPTEDMIARYDAWLDRAETLVAGLDPSADGADVGHRARLAELGARALPPSDPRDPDGEGSARAFAAAEDRWWHARLTELVDGIAHFADPESGLIEGLSAEWGWGIGRRRAFAAEVEDRSRRGARAEVLWSEAIASIADVEQCPQYGGTVIAPQSGLLPVGRSPYSGLWEFAHLASGDVAERDAEGRIVMTPETGIVFVLVPAGRFWMGAQSVDPTGRHYDPDATASESPVHEVELAPYFLAKFEMTQGQWRRLTGGRPSSYDALEPPGAWGSIDDRHPVEQVSWFEAVDQLRDFGLNLPTEAQWERAARGGTDTIWWCGDDRSSLAGVANVCDLTALEAGVPWRPVADWLRDGAIVHAPVGSYAANPFGFHDVHGNVWEWCLDPFATDYSLPPLDLAGTRDSPKKDARVFRGGSFGDYEVFSAAARRGNFDAELRNYVVGLRAARAVDG